MKYIAYYRVSTEQQGNSGLGLSSQRESVLQYATKTGGVILGEFTDIESGAKTDRQALGQAIEMAVEEKAILLVKKLDRLSREGFRITSTLEDLGVSYLDVDSPQDTDLIKNIKLALSKDEREKISERTSAALSQAKKEIEAKGYYITKNGRKIRSLGSPQNLGGEKALKRSIATRQKKARNHPANVQATAVIMMMRDQGKSFASITRFLNDSGFKTSRGNTYSQAQVKKLFDRATCSTACAPVLDCS